MPKGCYATHLYLKRNTYCFRWTFSDRLVTLLGKRELRRSLQTGNRRLATQRAVRLAARLYALRALFDKEAPMPQITPQQLQTLLDRYIHEAMAEMEDWRCTSGPLPDSEVDGELIALNYLQRDTRSQLQRHDHARVASSAEQLATAAGFTVAPGTLEHARLCRGMLQADTQLLDTEIKRTQGDYSGPFAFHHPPPAASVPLVPLSQVIQEFTTEHLRANRWSPKTQTDNAAILRDLVEILGNVPISTITKDSMRPYRQAIMALPPNRSKQRRYRGLFIAEILKLPDVTPISICRINKHFVLAAQFFNWALDKGYVTANPATGMSLPKEKRDDEARSPFTPNELQQIFHSEEFGATKCRSQTRSPYMFWLPVLGLYSGARIEELSSLRLDDVKQVGGTWVLDINIQHRTLKNKGSIRQVAMHPVVQQLGFLDYVEHRRRQGHAHLFPDLGVNQGRRGMAASKWFGRYLDRLGITGKDKVFHSLRHTVLNACKQQGIAIDIAREIAGHANESMTYGTYGKQLRPEVQLSYLIQLDFGVDLISLQGVWQKMMAPCVQKSTSVPARKVVGQ
jgi:integrase